MEDDEVLDLVDSLDKPIGTVNRKDYDQFLASKAGYIRAAELFIINDEGKLWVPVRTAHKTIAPNGYDYSAAGHVEAGDDYVETIIREAEEEIGLKLTPNDIAFIAKLKSEPTKYIRSIFLLRSNQTPTFNPDDFVSATWMTPDELLAAMEQGHPAKMSLPNSVRVLQFYLEENK